MPYSKTGSLDTLGDHAVICHRRDDIILRQDRLRDKIVFRSQRCRAVTSLRAEKPDARNKFLTWRCVFTMLVCWATAALDVTITSPLQPNVFSNAARKSSFALRVAEDRKFEWYSQQCANIGAKYIPLAFESFGGLSELVRKTLKRIVLLTDNRSLYSAGLSVAFSRLAQSVSVTLMRGNAIMLIARSA